MIINNKDYKINLLILSMENEIDVAIQTVETLLQTLESNITISFLLNGSRSPSLKALFTSHPSVRYYESKQNLGVAGGRNLLLNTKECKECDVVMLLDNDVIPPVDYVRSLVTFLLDTPDAGIVGATVLNYRPFFTKIQDQFPTETGVFKNSIYQVTNPQLRQYLLKDLRSENIYHLGMDKQWQEVYLNFKTNYHNMLQSILKKPVENKFEATIKDNTQTLVAYMDQTIEKTEVSNVIGCSQTFKRSLVEELGPLNNLFNPYGFEDSDYSVRAIKKGYKNYTHHKTFLIHGTDARHKSRATPMQKNQYWKNNLKGYTLFAHLHEPDQYRELAKRRIFYRYINHYFSKYSFPMEALYFDILGYQNGIEKIKETEI